MNEARARKTEREGDCLPAQPNHGQGRRQRPFRPVRFSFCLMSARLRRGGNANPDRDSASLLPLPVLRPLLLLLLQRRLSLISQSRFSHISALPSISATRKFLLSLFNFRVSFFTLYRAHLVTSQRSPLARTSLSLSHSISEARPLPLCVLCRSAAVDVVAAVSAAGSECLRIIKILIYAIISPAVCESPFYGRI